MLTPVYTCMYIGDATVSKKTERNEDIINDMVCGLP